MLARRQLLAATAAAAVLGIVVGVPTFALAREPSGKTRSTSLVVYIVRHAEKAPGPDPALTPVGVARAAELARVLQRVPVQALYSTDTKRTQQTASPTAKAKRLQVQTYDAKAPANLVQALLKGQEQTVLVVGHSNTIPGLVSAFGLHAGTELLQGYDDLFQVIVPPGGSTPLLQRLTYGARSKPR